MRPGESTNTSPLTVDSTYYFYESNIVSSDAVKFDLLFGDGTIWGGKIYWLASSCVYANNGYVHWCLRDVGPDGVGGIFLWNSYGTDGFPIGVRAVVTLKSDIKLTPAETANTWDFDTSA